MEYSDEGYIGNFKPMKYGIKLWNLEDHEITFIWETENKEFNEEFSKILSEFFKEKNGSVQIDKISNGNLETSITFANFAKTKGELNE